MGAWLPGAHGAHGRGQLVLGQQPVQLRGAQGRERSPQVCPAHLGDEKELVVKARDGSAQPQGPARLGGLGTEAEGQGSRPHVLSHPGGVVRSGRGSQARAAGPPHSGQLAPGCLVGMPPEGRVGPPFPGEARARPTECAVGHSAGRGEMKSLRHTT